MKLFWVERLEDPTPAPETVLIALFPGSTHLGTDTSLLNYKLTQEEEMKSSS